MQIFKLNFIYLTIFFRYLQLRHVISAQFPEALTIESDPLKCFLTTRFLGRPWSSIYLSLSLAHSVKLIQLLFKWQTDISYLTKEDWDVFTSNYVTIMISAEDRFIQVKFLHRTYYTPFRLAGIYATNSPLCTGCQRDEGTFYHMDWTCPKLSAFWVQSCRLLTVRTSCLYPWTLGYYFWGC